METRWSLGALRPIVFLMFLVFFALSVVVGREHAILGENDSQAVQRLLGSLASSFIFILTIDFVSSLQLSFSKREFRRVFGSGVISGDMKLAYPDFVLSTEVQRRLSDLDSQFIYTKDATAFPQPHYVDLPRAVAANDIQGAVLISGLFGEHTSHTFELTRDFDVVSNPEVSFVSFGLTSNDCTFMYLQRDREPLFQVVEEKTGVQYLKVHDGKRDHEYRSSATFQYGVILKYRPNPVAHPNRVWMICAGLGPVGTPAAAQYLAKHWQRLARLAGSNDFLVVVRTQHYAFHDAERVMVVVRRGQKRRRISDGVR